MSALPSLRMTNTPLKLPRLSVSETTMPSETLKPCSCPYGVGIGSGHGVHGVVLKATIMSRPLPPSSTGARTFIMNSSTVMRRVQTVRFV